MNLKNGLILLVTLAISYLLVVTSVRTFANFNPPLPRPNGISIIPAQTRDGRWEQDLTYLATQLPQFHIQPFTKLNREEFQALMDDLKKQIPKLSDAAIAVRLLGIMARFGDEHTSLSLPQNFRMFPFYLRQFQNDWYVIYAAKGFESLLGAKLMRVAKSSVADASQKIFQYTNATTSTGQSVGAQVLFSMAEVLNVVGLQKMAERGEFTFQLTNKSIKTMTLPSLNISSLDWVGYPIPLYLEQSDKTSWVKLLPKEKTAFVKFNLCKQGGRMAEMAKQVGEWLRLKKANRVILDLRGNPGGTPEIIDPLLKTFESQKLTYQFGTLYVFVDRGTFSSAVINATQIKKRFFSVKFIGEPTGGAVNFLGAVFYFKLPNSGLEVGYPTQRVDLQYGTQGGLAPDVEIQPTIQDWKKGFDPVFAYVLAQK